MTHAVKVPTPIVYPPRPKPKPKPKPPREKPPA